MKMLRKRRGTLVMVLVAVAAATVVMSQLAFAGTPSDKEAIGQAITGLVDRGVPVRSWSLEEGRLSVALQSASKTAVGTPDDPTYLSLVQREAFLAKSRGIEISVLKLEVTNTAGELLFAGNIVLDKQLDRDWSAGKALPEGQTVADLRAALTEKADLSGLTLGPISLTSDTGAREIHLAAVAENVDSANKSTASMMINLYGVINDMNAQQAAQIALVRLDITDERGAPLLKWIYDAQRDTQDWWQAPGMTNDWFESPPSARDLGPASRPTPAKQE